MGQKVHPYGFRLGYNRTWHSRWFAKRDFGRLLLEDLKLKKELKGRFASAGVSQIEIDRAANRDRKSTRLNSSHLGISYAVFCLKKKKKKIKIKKIKQKKKTKKKQTTNKKKIQNKYNVQPQSKQ